MSIKDLFDVRIKTFQKQHDDLTSASFGAESIEYIKEKQKLKDLYVPPIDFSTASNFAKYGSAELYYDFAFKRVFNHYPYDGTLAEKVQFETESTHLDRYILEYIYPRTNGYVNLGYQGLDGSKDSSGYNNATTKEYIFVFGSIHTASGGMIGKPIQSVFDKSNYYNVSDGAKQGASLEFKPVSGSTVEFWLKKEAFNATYADNEVVFDFWNQEISSSANYGRFTLNISSSEEFVLTWESGSTTGTRTISHPSLTISDGNWHHYAVSFQKANSATQIKFYQDGTLKHTTSSATTIEEIKGVSKGLSATIGALNAAPSGSSTLERGDGKFSGSMDEFRYWKKARTAEEIGLDWFCQVGGGNNNYKYNQELGIYFKFNEGITATNQDSVVLDYSGRIANGAWTGYVAGARNTGSAMVLSGKARSEFKDPIMYSYHPTVSSKHAEMKTSGSIQDDESTSMFYHLFPSWLVEDDEMNGLNTKYISQIVASYFDTVHAQIASMNSVKDPTYSTGSLSANTLANDVLREKGFVMPNMFVDANVVETFRGKDKNEIYERDIERVKDVIYQNIYNNVELLYKSKGTEKAYRNLFRCMGFDTELVKVNMYSDNSTLLVEDRYESKSVVKPVIKFNAMNNMSATIYQSSSAGLTYITGSEGDTEQYTSLTLEADFILPRKLKKNETGYFNTSFLSASVAGFHRALTSSAADYTWHSDDYNLRMYAVRDKIESENVRFVLTGSGVDITSSLYRMAYDNQKWLLATRVKHEDYPYAGITGSTAATKNYIVEFYGVNTNGPYIDNGPFTLSASVSNAIGKKLLSVAKRVYGGTHRTNYTGSALQQSDIMLSQVRYWQSYIENEELKQHALDSVNYGVNHATQTDSIFATPELEIPKSETLALHWDFGQVTTSDGTGVFTYGDRSSGSVSHAAKHSFIGNITNRLHEGKGEFFPNSSKDVVDKATIYSAKRKLAESAYSSDGVKIVGEDKEAFFQDDDRNDIYFSFEKSAYGAVSDEMMNMFATVKDFSNMVGLPVNRYRDSYKTADNLRNIFFNRVTNIPDPEKYFEYFKWIDTSVSYAISQLLPASTRFGNSVKNIVESHILERNKFREKFPFTSERVSEPIGSAIGAQASKVNWSISHAPPPNSPIPNHKHCVWQKVRRRFSDPEPTPAPISAAGIDTLRDVIHSSNNNKAPKFSNADGSTYEGGTYALRTINKPYEFSALFKNTIHGGTNYYVAKKRSFVHEVVRPHGPVSPKGIPVNVMVIGVGEKQGLVDQTNCEDKIDPNLKVKYDFHGFLGEFSDGTMGVAPLSDTNEYTYEVKGIMAFPINFMSQSVNGGYADHVNSNFKTNLEIANLHSDTIDITNDIPMQGPFTETHVGGHQSRHVKINKYDASLIDDETGTAPLNNIQNIYTRPEAWRLLIGEHSSSLHQDGAMGFVPADYGVTINVPITDPRYGKYPDIAKKRATFYRDEKAKRPVNVRHIQHDADGTRVGNYNKKYEVLNAVGRKENNLLFRVSSSLSYYLTPRISASLPHTTHPVSLFGQMPTDYGKGNVFGYHIDTNHRQPDGKAGAPTTTSFTITGSGVTGSAVGSIQFNEGGLGGQTLGMNMTASFTATALTGTRKLHIRSGSSIPSDTGTDVYVVTGANPTAFWNSIKSKLADVLQEGGAPKYGVTYSTSSISYSQNMYSSASAGTAVYLSASAIPDFNIKTTYFGMSAWIHLRSADASTANKTIFQFNSGSGTHVSRYLTLTGSELHYEAGYYDSTSPATTNVERHAWRDFETKVSGSWAHIILYHNRTGATGSGSVDLFVNGQSAISYGLAAPIASTPLGAHIAPSDAKPIEADGNIFFLNNSSTNHPFVGGIDEIAIWQGKDLSDQKIPGATYPTILYNGNRVASIIGNCALQDTSGPATKLMALYQFTTASGSAGETIIDSSVRGNNLTSSIGCDAFHHVTGASKIQGVQNEQVATFAITAVTGGDTFNSGIGITSANSCTNFMPNQHTPTDIAGGFISGSSPNGADIIQFSSSNGALLTPTFQIVNEIHNTLSPVSNIAVTASHTGSNSQFWNALSQSIKDNTVFGTINIVTSSNQATFSLTSSTNNEIYNDYSFRTVNNTVGQHTFISSGSFTGGDTEVNLAFDMVLPVPGRNKDGNNHRTETIISSRFAAPGGPEVDSEGFLDVYSREYSVHNALPYRNLTVRGKSSGEAGTIRLNTHLDKREGLATLLSRHSGKFGIDSRYGAVSETNYITNASYNKQHRNTSYKYALTGTVGSTTVSTAFIERHDNALIASPLPRSEFQYSWINSAVSGTADWRQGHNIVGYAPPNGIMQERNVITTFANFTTTGSYIEAGSAATWNSIIGSASSTKKMTFAFWFKVTGSAAAQTLLHVGDKGSANGHIRISYTTATRRIGFHTNYSGPAVKQSYITDNLIEEDEWTHLVITWDGSLTLSPKFYINSVQAARTSLSPAGTWLGIATDPLTIGNFPSPNNSVRLQGYMSHVSIYDIELSDSTVGVLYNNGMTDTIIASNSATKLFYRPGLNHKSDDFQARDSSSSLYDLSPNERHSEVMNNVTIDEESNYADIYPINFPSASEIFGV